MAASWMSCGATARGTSATWGWWPPENFKDKHRAPAEPWLERWKAPVEVDLPAARTVTVTDILGNSREVPPTQGRAKLLLCGSPVYVRGLGEMPVLDEVWPAG